MRMRREVEKLKKALLALSAMVEDSVLKAVRAVQERNEVLAREVIDRNLERLGKSIEESLILYRRMQAAATAWEALPDDPPDGHHICDLLEGRHESKLSLKATIIAPRVNRSASS